MSVSDQINVASMNPREQAMLRLIRDTMGAQIRAAIHGTPLTEAFVAALVANESSGNPGAKRFEAAEAGWFIQVMSGSRPAYQGITKDKLQAAILAGGLGWGSVAQTIEDLCTSWGPTQIMGWHGLKGGYKVGELQVLESHFKWAAFELMAFVNQFKLTLPGNSGWINLFHCWNAGAPHNPTSDPEYAMRGVMRMGLYEILSKPQ